MSKKSETGSVSDVEKTFLSSREAAVYLDRSEKTLKNWRSAQIHLPFVKDGAGRIWYSKADLDKFIQG